MNLEFENSCRFSVTVQRFDFLRAARAVHLEVNFAFHKLDALHLVVPTIMACALVVSSNRRLNFLVRSYKNVLI